MTARRKRLPAKPTQLLKPEAYISDEWLEKEYQQLFPKTWHFGCTITDIPNAGDYITRKIGHHIIFMMRNKEGEIKAFHNICRHRGTELLEGKGNTGKTIVCPYHRWTFGLDGELRGLPDHKECFPDLDKKDHGLLPLATGEIGGLVFVNPDPKPKETFKMWLADVPDYIWPHDITSPELVEFEEEVVYEMQCNWKVFYENAIDGYHLAYLHENTLGGPVPAENVWDIHGRHLLWYSTERDGHKNRIPQFVEENVGKAVGSLKHIGEPNFAGVYMLFPTTTVTATPYSFSLSCLEPIDANRTLLRVKAWRSKKSKRFEGGLELIPGYDKETGLIKSSHWTQHPLETGDFQTEDVWVVEKMQRALRSPAYQTTPVLAKGAGGEAPLTYFQKQVQDFMKAPRKRKAPAKKATTK